MIYHVTILNGEFAQYKSLGQHIIFTRLAVLHCVPLKVAQVLNYSPWGILLCK